MGCKSSKETVLVTVEPSNHSKGENLWNKSCNYYTGQNGARRDIAKAFELLQQAAKAGHGEALYNVGVCWEHGVNGAPHKDPSKGVECYQKAASDFENSRAMKALGYCYECGVGGLEVDYQQAFEWYQRSADAGLPAGIYSVGYCYQSGHGVTKDKRKSVEMYHRAADMGFSDANNALGNCYRYGIGTGGPNLAKALEFYTRAAVAGNVQAIYNVAVMHEKGEGMERPNLDIAMKLFRVAAQQGCAVSKQKLKNPVLPSSIVWCSTDDEGQMQRGKRQNPVDEASTIAPAGRQQEEKAVDTTDANAEDVNTADANAEDVNTTDANAADVNIAATKTPTSLQRAMGSIEDFVVLSVGETKNRAQKEWEKTLTEINTAVSKNSASLHRTMGTIDEFVFPDDISVGETKIEAEKEWTKSWTEFNTAVTETPASLQRAMGSIDDFVFPEDLSVGETKINAEKEWNKTWTEFNTAVTKTPVSLPHEMGTILQQTTKQANQIVIKNIGHIIGLRLTLPWMEQYPAVAWA